MGVEKQSIDLSSTGFTSLSPVMGDPAFGTQFNATPAVSSGTPAPSVKIGGLGLS
jgi:hypothetical protein